MKIKAMCSILTAFIMLSSPVNAIAYDDVQNADTNNEIIESIGLIWYEDLSCSVGTKKIHINMHTESRSYMSEIGFKNIHIERSSDGYNWETEKTISSETTIGSSDYGFNDYIVTVNGNHYYRVNLDHYARSGSTEEYDNNISNVIWVS